MLQILSCRGLYRLRLCLPACLLPPRAWAATRVQQRGRRVWSSGQQSVVRPHLGGCFSVYSTATRLCYCGSTWVGCLLLLQQQQIHSTDQSSCIEIRGDMVVAPRWLQPPAPPGEVPYWLRFHADDVREALTANSKLRPDQVPWLLL